jgi:chromosome segregation ATPase
LTDEQIESYRQGDIASEKLKKSLEKLQTLRAEFAEAAKKTGRQEQQLAEISKEQTRIRANMGSLDKSSELYKRYVQTLGGQEDQIQKLQESLKELRDAEAQAGKQLIDFGLSHSEE